MIFVNFKAMFLLTGLCETKFFVVPLRLVASKPVLKRLCNASEISCEVETKLLTCSSLQKKIMLNFMPLNNLIMNLFLILA